MKIFKKIVVMTMLSISVGFAAEAEDEALGNAAPASLPLAVKESKSDKPSPLSIPKKDLEAVMKAGGLDFVKLKSILPDVIGAIRVADGVDLSCRVRLDCQSATPLSSLIQQVGERPTAFEDKMCSLATMLQELPETIDFVWHDGLYRFDYTKTTPTGYQIDIYKNVTTTLAVLLCPKQQ